MRKGQKVRKLLDIPQSLEDVKLNFAAIAFDLTLAFWPKGNGCIKMHVLGCNVITHGTRIFKV